MHNSCAKLLPVIAVFLSLVAGCIAFAQQAPTDEPPANVAGKWTVYANDPDGSTSTKYFELKQDGETLSGHFKGPMASGGVEGTVHGKHVFIRVKLRHPLGFHGMVDGDRMHGTFHAPKGEGTFQAVRTQ